MLNNGGEEHEETAKPNSDLYVPLHPLGGTALVLPVLFGQYTLFTSANKVA